MDELMEETDKRYQRVEAQLKEVIDVFYYLYRLFLVVLKKMIKNFLLVLILM